LKNSGIHYLIISFFAALVLIPSLGNGFFGDDYSWLLKSKESTEINPGTLFFQPAPYEYFRPVPVVLFYGMWQLFGGEFISYRILVLLLHILTSIMVYKLLLKTGFGQSISFVSALIFSIMACHSETLYSINCINEVLAAFFVFTGLYLFLGDFRNSKIFSYVFFLAAVLSRESALCFIPLLILFNIKAGRKRFIVSLAISASVILSYFALRLYSYINFKDIYEAGNFGLLQLNPLIMIYKIFHFIINMVFPVKSIFYLAGFGFFEELRSAFINPGENIFVFAGLVIAAVSISVLIIITLIKINRKVFYFPIFIAVSGILIYLPFEGTAERFLYLPSLGIALLIGLVFHELKEKKYKLAFPVLISVVLIYSFSIYQRSFIWKEASEKTVHTVERMNIILENKGNVKNILLPDVPSIIKGTFFVNQYNFNHIWKYYYPDKNVTFWFYESPPDIKIDLTIMFSELALLDNK